MCLLPLKIYFVVVDRVAGDFDAYFYDDVYDFLCDGAYEHTLHHAL